MEVKTLESLIVGDTYTTLTYEYVSHQNRKLDYETLTLDTRKVPAIKRERDEAADRTERSLDHQRRLLAPYGHHGLARDVAPDLGLHHEGRRLAFRVGGYGLHSQNVNRSLHQ